jgi:outer membrane protein assembly factor BamA
LTAPARLPSDEKLVAPFVRVEWLEDRFSREQNRNLVGRPEFFALGLASSLQLGYASTGLGSSRTAWLYAGSVSRGFEPAENQTLMTSAAVSGRYQDGQVHQQSLSLQAQYYLRQTPRRLFYVSLAGDRLTRPDIGQTLELGGDNGLRGYPLRYQNGTQRTLLTVEQRVYTDLFIWQLFRVGGAAFFDVGRAWGGDDANADHTGWLRDTGIGLRIVSARAAFSNVLHIDLAFPLGAAADVRKRQFLVKMKTSF